MEPWLIWLLATVSVVLLGAGGYWLAVARLRALQAACSRQAEQLDAALSRSPEDPFGEARAVWRQLETIRSRLARLGVTTSAERHSPSTLGVRRGTSSGAAELEAERDLVRREVYEKTRRIETLEADKRALAEKIVRLQEELAEAQALRSEAAPPRVARAAGAAAPLEDKGSVRAARPASPDEVDVGAGAAGGAEELASLMDALQQEADALRAELAERDRRIQTLERQDTTGLTHELERIRKELQQRTEEAASLRRELAATEQTAQSAKAREQAARQEKEQVAARALESAAELRRAQERLRDLERELASRGPASMPPIPGTRPSAPAVPVPPAPGGSTERPSFVQQMARKSRTPFDRPDAAATVPTGPPEALSGAVPPPLPSRRRHSSAKGSAPRPAPAADPGRVGRGSRAGEHAPRSPTRGIFPLPGSQEPKDE